MFNKKYKAEELELMRKDYMGNSPFPHIVIDDFLDYPTVKLANKSIYKDMSTLNWVTADHPGQKFKKWIETHEHMPEPARRVSQWFNGSDFLQFLSKITGMSNLIPDNNNLGGGIHCSENGGRLGTHYDFNWNRYLGLIRRINVMLFMNYDWKPEWKGNFQMWKTDRSEVAKEVEPIVNRLVIFNTTKDSWHGFTEKINCPEDRRRLSFAKYYYQYPKNNENPGYKRGTHLDSKSLTSESIFPDDIILRRPKKVPLQLIANCATPISKE